MESFTYSLDYYGKLFEDKQKELLAKHRKEIYEHIKKSVKNSEGIVFITLDTRLDNVYRKKLVLELLERFKSINLIKNTSNNPQLNGIVEVSISSPNEIIDDITGIKIILLL